MKKTRGTVQVYTGNGKGKTTAALGLAMRALGHGQRVFMIQFMKKSQACGEVKQARRLQGFKIEQFGRKGFVQKGNVRPEDRRLAAAGLKKAREALSSRRYDLVILDEINVAMEHGLVAVGDVLDLLSRKPREVEIVLTGRHAPRSVIRIADTVSEMKEIKHHYRQGIEARRGVEF